MSSNPAWEEEHRQRAIMDTGVRAGSSVDYAVLHALALILAELRMLRADVDAVDTVARDIATDVDAIRGKL